MNHNNTGTRGRPGEAVTDDTNQTSNLNKFDHKQYTIAQNADVNYNNKSDRRVQGQQ